MIVGLIGVAAADVTGVFSHTVRVVTVVERTKLVTTNNIETSRSGPTSTMAAASAGTNPASVAAESQQLAGQTPGAAASQTAQVQNSASSTSQPSVAGVLAGKIVGVDPGHNGRNYTDPSYINRQIWNGREYENCNTTGTETDFGYTEAQFNFNVAMYLAADLRAQGAKVVLTRHTNTGVGPCVNERAHIVSAAHADVSVAIHADGGPPGGRGFTVLEPVADGINNSSLSRSLRFGQTLRDAFETETPMPVSTYDGVDGLEPRDDLAGLNLTTVPNVLIECGNMRNATDAALLISSSFQQTAAAAIDRAIVRFLSAD